MTAHPANEGGLRPPRPPHLSVIVPVYQEVENVRPLYAELTAALHPITDSYEVIFVDDGSRDGTTERLREICRSDPRVEVVRFARNLGQTAAIQAGFDRAQGEIFVTLDGDRQDDPADIPRLLERIADGHDVVAGWRKHRREGLLLRRIPSWAANWLLRKLFGSPVHDTGCALRAYRREIVHKTRLYAEMHRYLVPVMVMSGAKVTEVVVHNRPRVAGDSKYGLSRIWKVVLDLLALKMVLRFSSHPVIWFVILAVPFVALALAAGGATLYLWVAAAADPELPLTTFSTALLALFTAGQLALFGMIAELVVRVGDHREADAMLFEVERA